ncbi:hypothetical protein IscW_ISCW014962 [Ixodes scapularis]|uniref:Acyltransferase 3 domain-containing protein n=1 Tax=Ixodes scapularis TaxID=6945 RepID=B7QH52_IXOSC|nr:hypothetical protein IscW_ISCW014962 [Ixodes scapularis]|eukprot:XP_002414509.1 hypothetical protein IscW_ISCW014962 [Ixodes scapularis]
MHVYNKAFAHAGSLFTAIIFGSFAAKPHQLSRKAQAFWWTVAATFACTSLFGIYSWNRGRAPEHLESVVYAALHRVAWGFAVSWVMYACATGRGGPVNKILANPLLYPLGRLSFAAYLVHVVVMFVNIILGRERNTNKPFLEAQNYISLTITSHAFAAISYLCIECPIEALDSLAFGQFKGKPNSSVDAAKQNGAHELKSGPSANGTAGNGCLYEGYQLPEINGDNNRVPFSLTNYDDGLAKKECKTQLTVHEKVDPVEYRATTSNMWPPTELLCLLSAMVILGAIGTFGDTAAQSTEMPTSTLSSEIAETEDKFETMTKQFRRLAARRILPIASEIMSDPRFSPRRITNTAIHVYISPYVNAPSLFTAIIFGCLAAKPHKLSRKVQAFMWALSVALGIASVFTIFTWHSGRHPELLETAFYAGSHRFAWAFGVSWVMYACATGRGGPVNKILANPLFYPLGRLSYALYLVHLLVLACNAILNRDRRTYQPFLQD